MPDRHTEFGLLVARLSRRLRQSVDAEMRLIGLTAATWRPLTYLRSLGDAPGGNGSDILKLAIEQYQEIVKLDPQSVDDHLLLGRLYRLSNDMSKAEGELNTAIKLDPNSEEAVTTLAMLYVPLLLYIFDRLAERKGAKVHAPCTAAQSGGGTSEGAPHAQHKDE